jgi:hypothetical protein
LSLLLTGRFSRSCFPHSWFFVLYSSCPLLRAFGSLLKSVLRCSLPLQISESFWGDLVSRVRFFLPLDISSYLDSFFTCCSHLWQRTCCLILGPGFCSEIYQGMLIRTAVSTPSTFPARGQGPRPSMLVFRLPTAISFYLASFFLSPLVWVRSSLQALGQGSNFLLPLFAFLSRSEHGP